MCPFACVDTFLMKCKNFIGFHSSFCYRYVHFCYLSLSKGCVLNEWGGNEIAHSLHLFVQWKTMMGQLILLVHASSYLLLLCSPLHHPFPSANSTYCVIFVSPPYKLCLRVCSSTSFYKRNDSTNIVPCCTWPYVRFTPVTNLPRVHQLRKESKEPRQWSRMGYIL